MKLFSVICVPFVLVSCFEVVAEPVFCQVTDEEAQYRVGHETSTAPYRAPSDFREDPFGEFSKKRLPFPDERSVRLVEINGRTLAEFTLRQNDPVKSGSPRAELSTPKYLDIPVGATGEYHLGLYVPKESDWFEHSEDINPDGTAIVLAQWKGHNGRSPAVAIRLKNNGNLCVTVNNDQQRLYVYDQPFSRDQIHIIHMVVNWSPNESGYLHLMMNGHSLVSYRGPIGYAHADSEKKSGYYFKFGIYNPNRYKIKDPNGIKVYHLPYWYRH